MHTFFMSIIVAILVLSPVGHVLAQSLSDPDSMDRHNTFGLFEENTELNTYVDLLVFESGDDPDGDAKKTNTRAGLISTFCDIVLQQREDGKKVDEWYFDHGNYRYDPRQSMVMYGLCVTHDERRIANSNYTHRQYKEKVFNVGLGEGASGKFVMKDHWSDERELLTLWGLPEASRLDGNSSPSSIEQCDPLGDMQWCDFSLFAPKLFETIIDELVTMRQAALYGYRYYTPWEEGVSPDDLEIDLDKALEGFTYTYFMEGEDGSATCNNPDIHYLSSAQSTNSAAKGTETNRKHCSHPKTAKLVKDNIKNVAKNLQSLEYLDPTPFFKEKCDVDAKNSELHQCALSPHGVIGTSSDVQSFHNVLLNELMRYQLFLTYYLNRISTDSSYAPPTGIVRAMNDVRDEVSVMSTELALSSNAIETTLRMLDNIQMTYPIHIALQAYLEDVKIYKHQLANVYTPIHQTSYLLTNVQECG